MYGIAVDNAEHVQLCPDCLDSGTIGSVTAETNRQNFEGPKGTIDAAQYFVGKIYERFQKPICGGPYLGGMFVCQMYQVGCL